MSTPAPTYPVRVEGRMDPKLSRGLWLVKWLLLVPHAIVLAFLWVAFFAVSIVAMFAILFTGRYPRTLFDFNVGVLRWSWRVGFYAFNVNGTDRYPPFTLREVDYPATFSVEYPGELSRGLVLVKWWLLAIPHYVIVTLFIGGLWYGTHWGGAIAVLVLISVLALLFTGRYPDGMFDLVLGMNRWALRVAAYAGLMTDAYPPFRLDMGAMEPGVAVPAVAPPKAGSSRSGVLMAVFGSLGFIVGLGLMFGAAALVWVDQTQRDSAGFVMSPSERLATSSYAITADYRRTGDALEARSLAVDLHGPSSLFASDRLGTVRIHAQSQNGHPLFVGVAPTAAVGRYLGGVGHAALTGFPNGDARYATHAGSAPAGAPAAQRIWARTATGRGDVAITWRVRHGAWTVVVMNADASRGVAADAKLGARLGFLGELAGIVAAFALISGALAAWLALAGIRRVNRASGAA